MAGNEANAGLAITLQVTFWQQVTFWHGGSRAPRMGLLSTQTNISAAIIPHCRIFDAVDLAVARICIGTLVLSFKHCEMSSLPPSTPALQRILSGDGQAIMTEVSQMDAAGSAVLGDLLYSDAAVPKAAQKAVDAAEKKAEIARKRASSRACAATPTKRIYKPKRASQLQRRSSSTLALKRLDQTK